MSYRSESEQTKVVAFNRDVASNAGYLYTTNAQLSSQMANRRLTDITLSVVELQGKTVLDMGCGDGTYTIELYDRAQPAQMHGVDLADEAIKIATERANGRNLTFAIGSAYALPYADHRFDVVYLRGVLHHMDKPEEALREALRVASAVVVIEPNGYNPVLKLLERFSRYHVEHQEKSYAPVLLDQWIQQLGGRVQTRRWVGLVPMFCPDWMVRFLKRVEPIVERLPILSHVGCAVYVFVATRSRPSSQPSL